jgi:hypothetical protein
MEELYKILLTERENDSKRYWTIFNLMNIINAGLLAVITTEKNQIVYYRDVAAWFGIFLCIVWFLAEVRMTGWIKLWENKLEQVEEQYLKDIKPQVKVFRDRKNPKRWAFLPTRWIGPVLSVLFALVWLFIRWPCIPKSVPILNCLIRG